MSSKQSFHFFIGPVHEFVASARRTRDFQAGSLLLSWLAAVGALVAKKQAASRAESLFPDLPPQLENALCHGGSAQASMPNRFSIEIEDGFIPQDVQEAVETAWHKLADIVWQRDIQPAVPKEHLAAAKAVWERQVSHFWEIYWIVAPEDAPYAMDWRKNWRTPPLADEPGAKCSQMAGLQELSGIEGMSGRDIQARKAFWQALRQKLGNDLAPDEQLSAIALIKRRMYRHFADLKVEISPDLTVHGLKLGRTVPSTPFLAAYPELAHLRARMEQDGTLSDLLSQLDALYLSLGGEHGEHGCWPQSDSRPVPRPLLLDGQAWFEKTYDNPKGYGLKNTASDLRKAKQLVRKIWKQAGAAPKPFYALLSMDGDGLGKQMGEKAKRPFISRGLSLFTEQVPDIVGRHDGYLIYAGGDDVLALLPVPAALKCAAALRKAYLDAFEQINRELDDRVGRIETTLSGAVLFAHYDRPLNRMLDRVFALMESVAKDTTGRDALTVEVLKPSGRHLLWTQPWDHALGSDQNLVVEQLADRWRKDEETSHKFFYRLIDYLDRLAPELRFSRDMSHSRQLEGERSDINHVNDVVRHLWAVALQQSEVGGIRDISVAREAIEPLVEQCQPVRRVQGMSSEHWQKEVLRPDGALLVKFLMENGEAI